jgi:hypothetical protein
MSNLLSDIQFPYSYIDPFTITSPEDEFYNCIAWAYGDNTRFYWPVEHPDAYWPPGIKKTVEIDSFIELYSSIGYIMCDNAELEEGIEKVAIYSQFGVPTHAARQLPNGLWTSKLGRSNDVSHTLDNIRDGIYGNVTVLMKRQR